MSKNKTIKHRSHQRKFNWRFHHILGVSLFLLGFICVPVFGALLTISFTPQAPRGDWSEPWQNACEEASIVMIDNYYRGAVLTPQIAEGEISKIFRIKEKYYSTSLDENAAEIVSLINNYLTWEARVVSNPRLDEIKAEIDAQYPVIVPAYGKLLNNPYFKGTVRYHVFVITGYDDKAGEFIASDPGTQYGRNFHYKYETVMTALHDYVAGGDISVGPKNIIFTSDQSDKSLVLDGDADGLTKEEEIKLGTSLWLSDTDGDGYSDGEEVKSGYSPLVNEQALDDVLIKTSSNQEIYWLKNKIKRHLTSFEAFRRYSGGRKLVTVSDKFSHGLALGAAIK